MKKPAYILLFLLSACFLPLKGIYAQPPAEGEPSVLADGQPSVLKEDKAQSNYVYDLKVLIQKSRENIKNVNEKIKDQAVKKRNQQREEKAREYFLQAQKLADEGRLEESRQLYAKAISITEHPEMKYFIKESEHRAKLQKAALSKEESEQQRRTEEDEKTAFERVENMYQGAVSLYKQQRFKEAKEEFQTVEEVFPDYKAVRSYLQIIEQDIVQAERQGIKDQQKEIESQQKESEIARLREKELWRKEIDRKEEDRKRQVQKQAQGVYDEAIKLYQDRKYMAAKEKFQEVEWVIPDFKSTRSYLQRIERDLEVDKERVTQERQQTVGKQRWEETLSQKKAEEERKKAESMRERQKLEGKKDQAEFVYQSAIALFNKDQYPVARERFDEVENIYPDYRSTRDYLKRIDEMMKSQIARDEGLRRTATEQKVFEEESAKRKEEKERFKKLTDEADSIYAEAFELYKMGRLIEAKEKFLDVDKRVPDYKSTRSYLSRIDADIEAMVAANRKEGNLAAQQEQLTRLKELRDKADMAYNEAVLAYDNKNYTDAKAKFLEVESIYPNYKKAGTYLSRIDDDIASRQKEEERREKEKQVEGVYAQALVAYQNEEFEESKAKFIEVVSLVPDYKQTSFYLERIDDDVIRHKQKALDDAQERQAETLYNQAVALYQAGQYSEAKDKFLQLESVYSNYKDAVKVFANIDADIQRKALEDEQKAKAARAEVLYQQSLALYQAQDYTAAKEKFILTEVVYPDYKDTPKYLLSINSDIKKKAEDLEQRRKADEAEPLYVQALALYKEQDFEAAKKKFLQVQMACPGYKETERYLARVDEDIRLLQSRLAKEDRLSKAEGLYAQAMSLYSETKFEEAKGKFQEVAALESNYRNVRAYLARIDSDIRNEQARLARIEQEQLAEPYYAEAVALYHDGKFEESKPKFEKVIRILPDYKKARFYFTRIDNDIRSQKQEEVRQRQEQAEAAYREAAFLSRNGDDTKAYQKYSEVETIYPDFKATRKALKDLKEGLIQKSIVLPKKVLAVAPVVTSEPVRTGEEEVLALYKEGVSLYKDKKYAQAKDKFEGVERLRSGYRSTERYLKNIAVELPGPGEGAKPKEVLAQTPVLSGNSRQIYDQEVTAAEPLYKAALELYRSARYEEARVKFHEVEAVSRDYKSTREYLLLIAKVKGGPSPVVDQQLVQESRTVADLSQKSGLLYSQIRALADDKDLAAAAKTFSKIDKIVESLEQEKKRLARTIERGEKEARERAGRIKAVEKEEARSVEKSAAVHQQDLKQKQVEKKDEEERARQAVAMKEQQDLKRKERARLAQVQEMERENALKAEVLYRQGLGKLNDKNYALAKERFMDAQKVLPGYKDTDQLLVRIDKVEGEQKLLEQENVDHGKIATIAEKANAVNLEALALSTAKNFTDLQKKFDELSSLLKDIQAIKAQMLARREGFRVEWETKLAASRARSAVPRPIKDAKAMVEGRTARQQAEGFYKEGEVFYHAGQYAEARVKFRDAFSADPTFKAAYTFSLRVDRILERRDFEEQQDRGNRERRHFEDKQEGKEHPASVDDLQMPDPARAKEVFGEGIALYKAKSYKEARIKFEELMKVGDDSQRSKARRYLGLIESGIEKARQEMEKERTREEARYLEAKRMEIRMAWEKDKGLQAQQLADSSASNQRGQEVAVERQVLLRSIEQENDAQRKKMLAEKLRQKDIAERQTLTEWGKVRKIAAHQDVKMDVKAPAMPDKVDAGKLLLVPAKKVEPVPRKEKSVPVDEGKSPVQEVKVAVAVAATDVKTEARSREKLAASSMKKKPLLVTATDSREDAKFQRLITREKALEARETERKRLIMEQEHRSRELEKMRLEEKKQRALDNQNRREQRGGKAVVVSVPGKPEVGVQVPVAAVPVVLAPPLKGAGSFDVYKVAANEEKRRLEEQRSAIVHDFEVGVERLYVEAQDLYTKHAYEESKADFDQINELSKGYKRTEQYLTLINKELAKASYKQKTVAVPFPGSSAIKADGRQQAVSQMLDQAESGAVK